MIDSNAVTQASSFHTASGIGMGRVILAPTPRTVADDDADERLHDLRLLDMADREGAKSTCGAAKVGCVAEIWSGQLITGHNGAPGILPTCEAKGCTAYPATETSREYSRHLHAEMAVVAEAANQGKALRGATLYLSGKELCPDCAKMLVACRVSTVVIRPASEAWRQSVGAYLSQGGVSVRTVDA